MPGTQEDLTFATTQRGGVRSAAPLARVRSPRCPMRSSCNYGTRQSWQTMNSALPCSRAPQPIVGAWPLGTTASPFDFPTRRAIGFQQSGESGMLPLSAGRSVTRTTDPSLR
jgi:hypothetical protein